MKKTMYLFFILALMLVYKPASAQAPSLSVSPQSQCFTGTNTAVASVLNNIPGANTYSWAVVGSTCSATWVPFTTPNPWGATNNQVNIFIGCPGIYTVIASGWLNGNPIGIIQTTLSVGNAPPQITINGPNNVCLGSNAVLSASGASSYTWLPGGLTGSSITVSPVANTCYTVIGANSCAASSAVKCISVTPGGNNPVISGNLGICPPFSMTTLYASGATNYTWFPGGSTSPSITVSPLVTTCYTLAAQSCSSGIVSTVKCVTVGASPVISINGNSSICAGQSATLTASGASSYTWFTGMGTFTGTTIVLTPSATTCYSVIGSTGPGCSGNAGGCVTVSPPSNPVISGPSTICGNSTIILTATGANSYTWYPGGVVAQTIAVSPSVTTCYTVFAQSCNSINSAVKCVSVGIGSPTITVSGNNQICAGQGATLTASGASTYTWLTGMGQFTGSTIVLSPSATVCYSVIGSSGPNCIGYANGCVTVLPGGGSPMISGNMQICQGDSTLLFASGASNYTWFPGGATGNFIQVSPSSTTCYTLAGQSCMGIAYAVRCVTVIPGGGMPVISGSGIICSPSNGTVLFASGATSYTWLPGGATTPSIFALPSVATCYTLIANTCTGMASAVKCLSVAPSPTVTLSGNFSLCAGSSATLTASGASSYTWNTGQGTFTGSTVVLTPTSNVCISVAGSNGNGCTTYAYKCFTVSPANNPTIVGNLSICSGTTGSTTLYATGANSYTWLPGGSTATFITVSPSVTTCYTLVGQGCSGNISATVRCVTVGIAPMISVSGSTTVCLGGSATLTASGASSYLWYTGMGTYTGSSIVVTPSASICYSVLGTSASGCSAWGAGCVNVNPNAGNPVISGNLSICYPYSVTTLYASGASNYTWFPGGSTSPSIVVSPTTTTCYTLAGQGCSGIAYAVRCVTVGNYSPISVSGASVVCPGQSTTLTASGASSYIWYTSQGTYTSQSIVITPTAQTCYSVTGMQQGGNCSSSAYGCVVLSPVGGTPTISGNTLICSPQFQTVLNAGGGVYSYTWYPGGSTAPSIVASPSVASCYTLVANNCAGLVSAVKCISTAISPTVTITGNFTLCAGTAATLTASGASSYTWNTSQGTFTGSTIVFTPTNNPCVTVVGSNGGPCLGQTGRCLTVLPANTNPMISGNLSICTPSGSTTLFASGASNYTWMPGGSTSASIVVSPSVSTCYTLAGQACNGSVNYAVRCVTLGTAPVVSISGNSVVCPGGSATLTASGASTYFWLNSQNNYTSPVVVVTPSLSSMCFSVIGTNASGCSSSAAFCVSVTPGSQISISGPNTICQGGQGVLTASGGSGYTWLPSGQVGPTLTITPSSSTCYTVISSNSCGYASAVKCVSVVPNPVISVSGSSVFCSGSGITLVAGGASTYTWLPGSITGSSITVTPSASICYTVVGTNANGCVGLGYKCILPAQAPTITTSGGMFCAGSPGMLTANGAQNYTWITSLGTFTGSSIVITPSVSGCYTVVGTNGAGCTGSAVGCYSVLPSPVITISGNSAICAGGTTSLVASGASSYTWVPGNVTGPVLIVTPSVSTCYTVFAMNNFGCVSQAVKCVNVQQGAFVNISGANSVCSGNSTNLIAFGANSYTWNTGSTSPFITVTPSVSTCYTVVGTTTAGCVGTAVKCISVVPTPVVNISGPGSICAGSSAVLVASGAPSYIWGNGATTSSIVVSPSSTTIYSVTGINGSCSAGKGYTLVVNPQPTVSIFTTGAGSVICAGQTVYLNAVGASSYTWSNGATTASTAVMPLVTTSYTVFGNTGGCTNTSAITLNVSPCTGLSDRSSMPEISVYPNPSPGIVTIKGDGVNTISYAVYDVIGRELVKGEVTGTNTIDLSSFANGSYLIRYQSGKTTAYKKLIIEK